MSEINPRKNSVIDVFISYSSANEEIANMVVEGLSERGVNCWKAGTYTINSGDDFREKIAKALDECKIFLIILSERSMSTPWVRIELTEALRKNKKIYSLRIDDTPLDELFEFKLGCSQISDGTKNLAPVMENLAMNIKKDRDAWLEKERSEVYSGTKTHFFFDLAKLNGILFLFPLFVTMWSMYYTYTHPSPIQNTLKAMLEHVEPMILMTGICIFVHCVFKSNLKNYTKLGCTSAQYLTFKRLFRPLQGKKKRRQALFYLQQAADGGNYRAQIKMAKLLRDGKHLAQNPELAEEYLRQARISKSRIPLTVKKNWRSLALNVFLVIFLVAVYFIGTLIA